MTWIPRVFNRWRFNRAMAPIDRQIAEARRRHRPIRHLLDRKRALVHGSLRAATERAS